MNKWNRYGLDPSHFKKGVSELVTGVKNVFARNPPEPLVVTKKPLQLNSRVDVMNIMERLDALPVELQLQIASHLQKEYQHELSDITDILNDTKKILVEYVDEYVDKNEVLATLIKLDDVILGFDASAINDIFINRIYNLLDKWYDCWFDDIPKGRLISDSILEKYHLRYSSFDLVRYFYSHPKLFREGTVIIDKNEHYEGRMPELKGAKFKGIEITNSCAIVELLNFMRLPIEERSKIIRIRQHLVGGRRKRANKTQKRKDRC
jgi:hypothetical protein